MLAQSPLPYSHIPFVEQDTRGYHGRVLLPDNRVFTVGTFDSAYIAWIECQHQILDWLGVPHVHAKRALHNVELARMSDADLCARELEIRKRPTHKVASELRRIHALQTKRAESFARAATYLR